VKNANNGGSTLFLRHFTPNIAVVIISKAISIFIVLFPCFVWKKFIGSKT